ncbi:hypothetical protein [Microbacterium memoriense]|uniref:Lipoprotein n=1 Tax=Microbacterium memoriense TaxID=2978350 RepID=A0ABT2P945_9MICO|nr:hypothetical protein [Microbacterium memoriense]MCT9001156.1 hypothetical protein [Microbacterium memoriense]
MADRMRQIASAAFAAVVAVLLATGCAPEPASTPSPTGFASEEEAFAAAEATYRAYVDAVNARREDPASEPDPTWFLTGRALEVDLDGDRRLAEMGLRIEGPSRVKSISFSDASDTQAEVLVCLDSTASRVVNEAGEDKTPSDRASVVGLEIKVIWAIPSALIVESTTSGSQC